MDKKKELELLIERIRQESPILKLSTTFKMAQKTEFNKLEGNEGLYLETTDNTKAKKMIDEQHFLKKCTSFLNTVGGVYVVKTDSTTVDRVKQKIGSLLKELFRSNGLEHSFNTYSQRLRAARHQSEENVYTVMCPPFLNSLLRIMEGKTEVIPLRKGDGTLPLTLSDLDADRELWHNLLKYQQLRIRTSVRSSPEMGDVYIFLETLAEYSIKRYEKHNALNKELLRKFFFLSPTTVKKGLENLLNIAIESEVFEDKFMLIELKNRIIGSLDKALETKQNDPRGVMPLTLHYLFRQEISQFQPQYSLLGSVTRWDMRRVGKILKDLAEIARMAFTAYRS